MNRILLIEDSPEYIFLVERILSDRYQVDVAKTLADARKILNLQNCDLILLDVALPDGLGFDFCSEIRNAKKENCPPIIFLSGRSEVQDRVIGWSLGADDYITKPFSPAEFQVRVQNRIDKFKASHANLNVVKWGPLTLDIGFHEVFIQKGSHQRKLDLTPIEFKLLYGFIKSADRVLTRNQLIETAWGILVHVTERTVDKHISTLRQKLDSEMVVIKTVSGIGYRLTQNVSLGLQA